MELNPWLFVLMAYGMAAVIAVCVAFIIKIIALLVQRKNNAADEGAKPESSGR